MVARNLGVAVAPDGRNRTPDRKTFRAVVEWDRNLALLGAGTGPGVAGK